MAQNAFFASPDGKQGVKAEMNGSRNDEEENETDEDELEKSLFSYEQFDNRWGIWLMASYERVREKESVVQCVFDAKRKLLVNKNKINSLLIYLRSSPDLWPDQIPGVSDFVALETNGDSKGKRHLVNHDRVILI